MKRWAAAMLSLLLIFCIIPAKGAYLWTEEQLGQVIPLLISEELESIPPHQRIIPARRQWDEAKGLDKDWMHVLLLSTGSQNIRDNFGKADVCVIFSMHMKTGDFHLISIPWDSLIQAGDLPVPIPLTCVNCFGGPALMIQSLNRALSLNISRYCAVNEDAFFQVVAALGGVQIPLLPQEQQALGYAEDTPWMDETQALEFVQLPLEGYDRAMRLIAAAYEQFMNDGSLEQAFDLADQLLPCIDTNLTTTELLDLLFCAFSREEAMDFTTRQLPVEKGELLDEAAGRILRAMIYGEE